MPTRALITGGTGFVGANLVAFLNERGINARVLHRSTSSLKALEGLDYESVIGDILDPPNELANAMADCDWVFHAAAVTDYWRQNREKLYRVNVQGTKNVLEAAKLANVRRLVLTSSIAALGIPSNGQLLDESSDFNLRPEKFAYAHSKLLAEIEVSKAVEEGLAAVIVNLPLIVGPRDVNMIAGSAILEAAKGWIWIYPPGGSNFAAVEDIVAGHIEVAKHGRVGERYILAGENLTHQEALTIICQVVGRKPPFIRLPTWFLPIFGFGVSGARLFFGNRIPLDANQAQVSGKNLYVDGRKARQEFDLPHTPFKVAVQRAYDWYNKNGYIAKRV